MKRIWLILCLVLLFGTVGAMGIYREASLSLTQALTRFTAALPADASFTYGSVQPSFLVHGVTLRDVTFRQNGTYFHARVVRLGRPQYLAHGQLSLSSLVLKDAAYSTPTLHLTLNRTLIRHLLVPPSGPLLEDNDQVSSSMRSLAAVMTFNPARLETLQFAQLQMNEANLQLASPATFNSNAPSTQALGLHALSIHTLTLEGYGAGTHVLAQAAGIDIGVSARLGALARLSPIAIPPAFLPVALLDPALPTSTSATPPNAPPSTAGTTPAPASLTNPVEQDSWRPFHVTLDYINVRDGEMRLLSHPFRGDSQMAQRFWRNPAQIIWSDPGTLGLEGLRVQLGEAKDAPWLGLDHMLVSRRHEEEDLRTEAELRGFHLRDGVKLPYPINGTASVLRFSELSHALAPESAAWLSDVSLQVTVQGAGEIALSGQTRVPRILPHFSSEPTALEETASFAQRTRFSSLVITAKGDRLTDLLMAALQFQHPDSPASEIRYGMVQDLNNLAMTRPLLAPLADYLLNPQNRTLKVEFGALTLHDLHELPVMGAPDAILDALHVTALTAQP